MGKGMKFSVIGIIIWICAAIYWGFEKISDVVPKSYDSLDTASFDIFTIEGITKGEVFDWIDSIPWNFLHHPAEVIATTHISLLLLAVGLVFIVIGMFFKT